MTTWLEHHQRVGIAVCSPHRMIRLPSGEWITDTITVDWHRRRTALSFPTNIVHIEYFVDGKEVGVARTLAAYNCLKHEPRPEFLFFLDDDVLPNFDALTKLYAHARWRDDHDLFAGVYCCKFQNPSDPLIYAGDGAGGYWDWAVGDILTTDSHGISSVHMGLTLIRVSVFQRLLDAGIVNDEVPFFQTVDGEKERTPSGLRSRQGTEDIWFCNLLTKLDPPGKILVDTSVLAGHIDKQRGITYGLHAESPPVLRAKWMTGKDREEANQFGKPCKCVRFLPDEFQYSDLSDEDKRNLINSGKKSGIRDATCPICNGKGYVDDPLKLALDLGAGGYRRQWLGHKTYTLDIRPDTKPDYCQDTRSLNFPNDHWDLIASRHHLEHIGRWDQETVWREMARILKPGGAMEHVVPSLEWAASKVAEGEVDEHVLNVLYGAQEVHGYNRMYNCHFFGYTKAIAKALAEQAGLVDVTCEDWRDDPNRAFEMLIKARKPEAIDDAQGRKTGAVDGEREAGSDVHVREADSRGDRNGVGEQGSESHHHDGEKVGVERDGERTQVPAKI